MSSLQTKVRLFAEERDWERFHTPKNLAMALSVEVGELLERFLWATDETPSPTTDVTLIEEEIADVYIYLLRLCDVLEVDLEESAQRKLALNAKRYPVALAKGNAKKYTELRS